MLRTLFGMHWKIESDRRRTEQPDERLTLPAAAGRIDLRFPFAPPSLARPQGPVVAGVPSAFFWA